MKIPKLPKDPVLNFMIEWFTFAPLDSYKPGPRRHVAIYLTGLTWDAFIKRKDLQSYHSYVPGDSHGAPFHDEWLMLNEDDGRMRFDGRCVGWDWVNKSSGRVGGVDSAEERWAERYATREEALKACRTEGERLIKQKENNLAELKKDLARLG